ncbi:AAA domain-containing protein [Hirsutella rhossiliensis]|uniref:AAA domain-containing protein n=1 Tax=Hirsutella rhossiliensis TaxID=111463 RepID=A0A9P8N8F1_9HYPO|nr:AAA domain-containing protein [Hirsutella rhossiliensis]KAH0968867.1 AAA domain-containing protein [Hirsutella rhossiliensis]
MEDQRRPSHAAGYPASADTKRGGNLAAADTEGGRALAAARRAQRRLGLREKPARTKRNPASADSRGRRSSPPPTRSSDVPRDIRPQPTWRAAGPSPPTRSSDAPRDIQALSTPTAAGRRLPQGGPSAVSASGKSQRAPREIRPLPTVEAAGPSPPPTRSSDVPRDIRPQPTWRAAGPSPPSSGTSSAVVSIGSQHSPRAIQSRPASRAEIPATTPAAAGLLAEDLASALRHLDEEFEAGERLANEQTWCAPVPRERQVRTVRKFYRAFHDAGTLPIATCTLCYRKRAKGELREMAWEGWEGWSRSGVAGGGRSPFGCQACFPEGRPVAVCAECARWAGREGASPAMHLHGRLGCEHAYPDELKDLTPLEEKLISLNSCYGFVTKYSIPGGQRQSVLPHPLVRVMDEIHVSWQGAERPGPRDLSGLLSVRRSAVERALAWLKENNPLYGEVEIDAAEIASWGAPPHGVPPVVCERLERNEPSARERTQTAQVVPPSERAMDDGGAAEIEEVLAMLRQGQDPAEGSRDVGLTCEDDDRDGARPEEDGDVINEVTSSGMFPLDGAPDVADAEKIRFAATRGAAGDGGDGEPYIQVRRGEDFADSADASFFAKAFPTLFPLGAQAERVAEGLMSTRNMKLQAWADVVLRRHGGRFATHPIFAFLVFNMGVRSKNRQASMLGVARKNFARVEGLLKSLTAQRLEAARAELEATGKTSDDGVKELLRSLSVFGYRQPMSRESRLSMRKKILSLIVRYGVPAIWFTLNPNDITNLVKLRLAAHRGRDPDEAEAFLSDLGTAYKRTRLAISDPMSSAVFFHREMTLFFEHYVNVGEESVFGHVGAYYGAVETNERGALHIHGLLWLRGNAGIGDALAGPDAEEQAAYRERIVRYVDSVFSEELDAEGYCAMQAERSATADISSRLDDVARFTDTFDEEANFCAGATQIHTHSATCAPWRLVERTALTADGVLEIRRTHSMVNRWNRAMAVGLRHNHDISFIATQRKTMALIYYITNYATKVEDPVWKRVAAAAEFLPVLEPTGEGNRSGADRDGNKTRTFLLKAANRVFTERPLSQVEVIAHLLGYPAEFSSGSAWAYINANQLYWAVFRRWRHLRRASGAEATGDAPDETVVVEEAGLRIPLVEAYRHRGELLRGLCLYDYASLVRLKQNGSGADGGEEAYRAGGAGDAARLIDVVRNAASAGQVTAQSTELLAMTQQLCRFQQSALGSAAELAATVVADERAGRRVNLPGSALSGAALPRQEEVRAIKSQQRSAARERERAIQGIQGGGAAAGDDIDVTAADGDADAGTAAGMRVRLGPSSSFVAAGRELAGQLTLNEKQAIALLIVCRQLDRIRQGDDAGGDGGGQLCLFIGGEGGTGKSRVIEALVELLARRDLSSRVLVTATSGTAAARINGITLHSACGLTVGQGGRAGGATRDIDGVRLAGQGERFVDGRSRMDWQEKEVLVIDEVSMLGARTLHAANEQLCRLRGFRPVQERSILLPSAAVAWDEDGAFAAEQRRQHDKAHALWRRFTTVVMLDEQMRAAGDPELRRLLGRIRRGEQDRSDLELLNSRCYRPGRRIPWETGLTVVTPLNRNRWNLNLEAALAFRERRRTAARVFLSEHKWRDGVPTEEEAVLMLGQGDDSATPVPAVFLFVPGMPVVVNQNTHQGLKLVNGAGYTAVDVIPDRAFPATASRRSSSCTSAAGGHRAGLGDDQGLPLHHSAAEAAMAAQRRQPEGLPCAAAFACTDYKVQGGTPERVALELRGRG